VVEQYRFYGVQGSDSRECTADREHQRQEWRDGNSAESKARDLLRIPRTGFGQGKVLGWRTMACCSADERAAHPNDTDEWHGLYRLGAHAIWGHAGRVQDTRAKHWHKEETNDYRHSNRHRRFSSINGTTSRGVLTLRPKRNGEVAGIPQVGGTVPGRGRSLGMRCAVVGTVRMRAGRQQKTVAALPLPFQLPVATFT
jgi:hypothetical protein